MELRVMETDGRYSHVRLIGKMDAPGAQEIDAAFASAVAGPLRPAIVDMAEVPFLSSMGVRTLMQAITRNPLADPGLLGVNAGAGLAVVLAVGVFGLGGFNSYVWFALAGACGIALWRGRRKGQHRA